MTNWRGNTLIGHQATYEEATAVAQPEQGRITSRWLVNNDMPDVMAIEVASYDYTWTHENFEAERRKKNNVFQVAELNRQIIGFIGYELDRKTIRILNMAVCPNHRRIGVGQHMVSKLIGKLCYDRRNEILAKVRESNLAAQLFFRSAGFKACQVLKGFYDDSAEDSYEFRFDVRDQKQLTGE